MIPEGTYALMQEIDNAHQSNIISRDIALEMIADLLEGNVFQFKDYLDDLLEARIKELMEQMREKYLDLFHELENGKIDQNEFLNRYSKLLDLERNSYKEVFTDDENLRTRVR